MISLIVATLGQRKKELVRLLDSLQEQTYKDFEIIIISQSNYDIVDDIINDSKYNLKIIHKRIYKKGLSLARNIGINMAKGNIISFSDDDCWYNSDSLEKVKNAFDKLDVDILQFEIFDPIKSCYYKEYNKKSDYIKKNKIKKVSSIELFFYLKRIKKSYLKFDESFGVGAKYPAGEEIILMNDLLRKKYVAKFIPDVIVYHPSRTIGEKNSNYLWYGPFLKRIYPNNYISYVMFNLYTIKRIIKKDIEAKYIMEAKKRYKEYIK